MANSGFNTHSSTGFNTPSTSCTGDAGLTLTHRCQCCTGLRQDLRAMQSLLLAKIAALRAALGDRAPVPQQAVSQPMPDRGQIRPSGPAPRPAEAVSYRDALVRPPLTRAQRHNKRSAEKWAVKHGRFDLVDGRGPFAYGKAMSVRLWADEMEGVVAEKAETEIRKDAARPPTPSSSAAGSAASSASPPASLPSPQINQGGESAKDRGSSLVEAKLGGGAEEEVAPSIDPEAVKARLISMCPRLRAFSKKPASDAFDVCTFEEAKASPGFFGAAYRFMLDLPFVCVRRLVAPNAYKANLIVRVIGCVCVYVRLTTTAIESIAQPWTSKVINGVRSHNIYLRVGVFGDIVQRADGPFMDSKFSEAAAGFGASLEAQEYLVDNLMQVLAEKEFGPIVVEVHLGPNTPPVLDPFTGPLLTNCTLAGGCDEWPVVPVVPKLVDYARPGQPVPALTPRELRQAFLSRNGLPMGPFVVGERVEYHGEGYCCVCGEYDRARCAHSLEGHSTTVFYVTEYDRVVPVFGKPGWRDTSMSTWRPTTSEAADAARFSYAWGECKSLVFGMPPKDLDNFAFDTEGEGRLVSIAYLGHVWLIDGVACAAEVKEFLAGKTFRCIGATSAELAMGAKEVTRKKWVWSASGPKQNGVEGKAGVCWDLRVDAPSFDFRTMSFSAYPPYGGELRYAIGDVLLCAAADPVPERAPRASPTEDSFAIRKRVGDEDDHPMSGLLVGEMSTMEGGYLGGCLLNCAFRRRLDREFPEWGLGDTAPLFSYLQRPSVENYRQLRATLSARERRVYDETFTLEFEGKTHYWCRCGGFHGEKERCAEEGAIPPAPASGASVTRPQSVSPSSADGGAVGGGNLESGEVSTEYRPKRKLPAVYWRAIANNPTVENATNMQKLYRESDAVVSAVVPAPLPSSAPLGNASSSSAEAAPKTLAAMFSGLKSCVPAVAILASLNGDALAAAWRYLLTTRIKCAHGEILRTCPHIAATVSHLGLVPKQRNPFIAATRKVKETYLAAKDVVVLPESTLDAQCPCRKYCGESKKRCRCSCHRPTQQAPATAVSAVSLSAAKPPAAPVPWMARTLLELDTLVGHPFEKLLAYCKRINKCSDLTPAQAEVWLRANGHMHGDPYGEKKKATVGTHCPCAGQCIPVGDYCWCLCHDPQYPGYAGGAGRLRPWEKGCKCGCGKKKSRTAPAASPLSSPAVNRDLGAKKEKKKVSKSAPSLPPAAVPTAVAPAELPYYPQIPFSMGQVSEPHWGLVDDWGWLLASDGVCLQWFPPGTAPPLSPNFVGVEWRPCDEAKFGEANKRLMDFHFRRGYQRRGDLCEDMAAIVDMHMRSYGQQWGTPLPSRRQPGPRRPTAQGQQVCKCGLAQTNRRNGLCNHCSRPKQFDDRMPVVGMPEGPPSQIKAAVREACARQKLNYKRQMARIYREHRPYVKSDYAIRKAVPVPDYVMRVARKATTVAEMLAVGFSLRSESVPAGAWYCCSCGVVCHGAACPCGHVKKATAYSWQGIPMARNEHMHAVLAKSAGIVLDDAPLLGGVGEAPIDDAPLRGGTIITAVSERVSQFTKDLAGPSVSLDEAAAATAALSSRVSAVTSSITGPGVPLPSVQTVAPSFRVPSLGAHQGASARDTAGQTFNGSSLPVPALYGSAASVNAPTALSANAVSAIKKALESMIKVDGDLPPQVRDDLVADFGNNLMFTSVHTSLTDHPYLAAGREVLRDDFERRHKLHQSRVPMAFVGAAAREVKLYFRNPSAYFVVWDRDGRDLSRSSEALAELAAAGKSFHGEHSDLLRAYLSHLGGNPDHVVKGGEAMPCVSWLVYMDSAYYYSQAEVAAHLVAARAHRAIGYMVLPWEFLFPHCQNKHYTLIWQHGDVWSGDRGQGRVAMLTHGSETGYEHDASRWASWWDPGVDHAESRTSWQVGLVSHGPFSSFDMVPAVVPTMRCLTVPSIGEVVMVADFLSAYDPATDSINTAKISRFAVPVKDWNTLLHVASTLQNEEATLQHIMTLARRFSEGTKMLQVAVTSGFAMPREHLLSLAVAIVKQLEVMRRKLGDMKNVNSDSIRWWSWLQSLLKPRTWARGFMDWLMPFVAEGEVAQNVPTCIRQRYIPKFMDVERPFEMTPGPPLGKICWYCALDHGTQAIVCQHRENSEMTWEYTEKHIRELHSRVVQERLTAPPELAAVLKTFTDKMPRHPRSWRCQVMNIKGAFGTGKSRSLREIADHFAMMSGLREAAVICPFSKLGSAYMFSFDDNRLYQFFTPHRGVTLAGAKFILVDEAGALDYAVLSAIIQMNEPVMVVIAGDENQTVLQESEGESIYPLPAELSTHTLIYDYRNPADVVAMMRAVYPHCYDYLRSPEGQRERGFKVIGPGGTVPRSAQPLVFSHLSAQMIQGSSTIRSFQGGDVEDVVLYLFAADAALMAMDSMNIVGLTRHKRMCYIVSDGTEVSELWLKKHLIGDHGFYGELAAAFEPSPHVQKGRVPVASLEVPLSRGCGRTYAATIQQLMSLPARPSVWAATDVALPRNNVVTAVKSFKDPTAKLEAAERDFLMRYDVIVYLGAGDGERLRASTAGKLVIAVDPAPVPRGWVALRNRLRAPGPGHYYASRCATPDYVRTLRDDLEAAGLDYCIISDIRSHPEMHPSVRPRPTVAFCWFYDLALSLACCGGAPSLIKFSPTEETAAQFAYSMPADYLSVLGEAAGWGFSIVEAMVNGVSALPGGDFDYLPWLKKGGTEMRYRPDWNTPSRKIYFGTMWQQANAYNTWWCAQEHGVHIGDSGRHVKLQRGLIEHDRPCNGIAPGMATLHATLAGLLRRQNKKIGRAALGQTAFCEKIGVALRCMCGRWLTTHRTNGFGVSYWEGELWVYGAFADPECEPFVANCFEPRVVGGQCACKGRCGPECACGMCSLGCDCECNTGRRCDHAGACDATCHSGPCTTACACHCPDRRDPVPRRKFACFPHPLPMRRAQRDLASLVAEVYATDPNQAYNILLRAGLRVGERAAVRAQIVDMAWAEHQLGVPGALEALRYDLGVCLCARLGVWCRHDHAAECECEAPVLGAAPCGCADRCAGGCGACIHQCACDPVALLRAELARVRGALHLVQFDVARLAAAPSPVPALPAARTLPPVSAVPAVLPAPAVPAVVVPVPQEVHVAPVVELRLPRCSACPLCAGRPGDCRCACHATAAALAEQQRQRRLEETAILRRAQSQMGLRLQHGDKVLIKSTDRGSFEYVHVGDSLATLRREVAAHFGVAAQPVLLFGGTVLTEFPANVHPGATVHAVFREIRPKLDLNFWRVTLAPPFRFYLVALTGERQLVEVGGADVVGDLERLLDSWGIPPRKLVHGGRVLVEGTVSAQVLSGGDVYIVLLPKAAAAPSAPAAPAHEPASLRALSGEREGERESEQEEEEEEKEEEEGEREEEEEEEGEERESEEEEEEEDEEYEEEDEEEDEDGVPPPEVAAEMRRQVLLRALCGCQAAVRGWIERRRQAGRGAFDPQQAWAEHWLLSVPPPAPAVPRPRMSFRFVAKMVCALRRAPRARRFSEELRDCIPRLPPNTARFSVAVDHDRDCWRIFPQYLGVHAYGTFGQLVGRLPWADGTKVYGLAELVPQLLPGHTRLLRMDVRGEIELELTAWRAAPEEVVDGRFGKVYLDPFDYRPNQHQFSAVGKHEGMYWNYATNFHNSFSDVYNPQRFHETGEVEPLVYARCFGLTPTLMSALAYSDRPLNWRHSQVVEYRARRAKLKVAQMHNLLNRRGHFHERKHTKRAHAMGLGNVFSNRVYGQEVNCLLKRYSNAELRSKPLSEVRKAIVDKILTRHWTIYKVDAEFTDEDLNVLLQSVITDAKDRHYPARFAGAREENHYDFHRIRFHLKDIFKPVNMTKKWELDSVAQGIAATGLNIVAYYQLMTRFMAFMRRKTHRNDDLVRTCTAHGQPMEEYIAEFTGHLHYVHQCGAIDGVIDQKRADSGATAVTQYLDREYWAKIGFSRSYVDSFYAFCHHNQLEGEVLIADTEYELTSGQLLTKETNEIKGEVLGNYVFAGVGPQLWSTQGDDTFKSQADLQAKPERLEEVDLLTNIGWTFDTECAMEFCGFIINDGFLAPNIYRKLLQVLAYKCDSYEKFQEYQVSLHQYLNFCRRVGYNTILGCVASLYSEWGHPLAASEFAAIWDCLCTWATATEAEWLQNTRVFEWSEDNFSLSVLGAQ